MQIVIDSNIIVADYHLSSPHMKVLSAYLQRTNGSLLIPRIVLQEVINKYREQLEKLRGELSRLLFDSAVSDIDVESKAEEYSNDLRLTLKSFNIRYLDFPPVSHEEVANRAMNRRKPFSDSGRGYRDTIIWESILADSTSTTGEIAFITNNIKDYAEQDSNRLHPDLRSDLYRLGVQGNRIILYTSLADFLNRIVTPQMERLDDTEKQLREETFAPLSLQILLEQREMQLTNALNLEFDDAILSPDFDMLGSLNILYPPKIDSVKVYQNDEATLFIEYTAILELEINFRVSKKDYGLTLEGSWVGKWGETLGVTVLCSLVFDLKTAAVSAFKILEAKRR